MRWPGAPASTADRVDAAGGLDIHAIACAERRILHGLLRFGYWAQS